MTTPAKPAPPSIIEVGQKHARIIELLAKRITARATLDNILANANQQQIATLLACDESMAESIKQNALAELEIERLARELIPDDAEERSIKTPLGTIKLTRTTALVSPEDGGDELVIALIEDWARGDLPKRHATAFAEVGVADPYDDFLRIEKKLNREALERLPDAALAVLRLKRVATVKFSIAEKSLTAAQAQAIINTAKAKAEGSKS